MSSELKENVIAWVKYDDEISKYKKELSDIKDKINNIITKRENFESNIIEIMETNKLEKKDIIISDGKIKYNQSKTSNPLTKKYLEKCLIKYFNNNKEQSEELLNYIYKNREIVVKTSIKRYNNKEK